MSLLDEYKETFVLMDKTRTSDGMGGYITVYVEGVTIEGAMALASDTDTKKAEAMKEVITNTLLVDKAIELDYHDVLKRSDGSYYRVTMTGKDVVTPASSSLNLRKVGLEAWEIPTEV
jgi:hypothetical protein